MNVPTDRSVLVTSADDHALVYSVGQPTAAQPVTLQELPTPSWNSALSQWVFRHVGGDVYGIELFATQGALLLTAKGTTTGSKLELDVPSPANESQLWQLSGSGDDGSFWLACSGAPDLEVGFPGDYPVPGSPLQLAPGHDAHTLGDRFTLAPVPRSAEPDR
jgi:hypothetical protein